MVPEALKKEAGKRIDKLETIKDQRTKKMAPALKEKRKKRN